MTTAADLLNQLHAQGLRLGLDPQGRLQVGPKAALTPEVRALIQTHKAGLIAALERYQDAAEFYEERAAIMEYEAGLTRKKAETEAAGLTVVRFELHGGQGGGSVSGHYSAEEIINDLRLKYGAKLAEAYPVDTIPLSHPNPPDRATHPTRNNPPF